MKKTNRIKLFGLIVLVAVMGLSMAGCDFLFGENDQDGNGGSGGNGSSGGAGSTKEKAMSVTVGNSSSHTISSSGTHWFKFVGTGDPVIFETTGNVVDTYINVEYTTTSFVPRSDDNSGDGSNALLGFTSVLGETYYIRITARSGTSGTYTFVIKAPTSNLKANPITVSVGNSSSHTIFSSGTHWFKFTGTGNRVFFETEGNVVNTNMSIYIGDSTSQIYSKSSGNKGINFFTIVGTTYYINITGNRNGNSGTYTFNVRNGIGDGSSKYNAIEVTKGYSSSHTITSSGEHWFMYMGTGNNVTFKTTGNVVDTYINVEYTTTSFYPQSNDNSGDGSNALLSFTSALGETYWIRITARSSTSGTYTFVVE